MIKNRTIQLTQYVTNPESIGSKLRAASVSISDQITELPEEQKYTNAKEIINKLKMDTESLQKSRKEYFKATQPKRIKQIYDSITARFTSGNKLLQQLKPLIQEINEQFKKDAESDNKANLVECHRITQSANEAVIGFRDVQEKLSNQMKNTIKRQANIVQGQEINAEELEKMLHSPQKGQQKLKEKLLQSPSVQLENYVSDIIDKCNDVLKLEKSMRQCIQLMQELALLVQFQGEKLTTIEMAIEGAQNHLISGDTKLESGKQLHKKSKKKMCCIMMIVIAIIGVIVIPIVLTKL